MLQSLTCFHLFQTLNCFHISTKLLSSFRLSQEPGYLCKTCSPWAIFDALSISYEMIIGERYKHGTFPNYKPANTPLKPFYKLIDLLFFELEFSNDIIKSTKIVLK